MDKEMIERVAEAIRLRAIERAQPIHPVMVRHLAVAGILAMREPTAKMLEAGATAEGDCFQQPEKNVILEIHHAMIDAITGAKNG